MSLLVARIYKAYISAEKLYGVFKMMTFQKQFLVLAAVLAAALMFLAPAAEARPVTYAQGWMFMQSNDPFMNSAMAIYSPTARLGIGPVVEHWRDSDTNFAGAQFNALIRRWNSPDSQANFYFLSSAGQAFRNDDTGAAVNAGIEADWENRRFFTSFENRVTLADDIKKEYTQKARLGVAPYIAEYGGFHTWLMLQVDHRPEDNENFTVTPLIRMFKGPWLGEAGVNSQGGLLFNTVISF
jgi:hypothetical protein